ASDGEAREVERRRLVGDRRLRPGEGVAGQVFASGEVYGATAVSERGDTLRVPGAAALGLRSLVAAPIAGAGKITGSLALYSRKHVVCDDHLVRCVEVVGSGIGEFLWRLE